MVFHPPGGVVILEVNSGEMIGPRKRQICWYYLITLGICSQHSRYITKQARFGWSARSLPAQLRQYPRYIPPGYAGVFILHERSQISIQAVVLVGFLAAGVGYRGSADTRNTTRQAACTASVRAGCRAPRAQSTDTRTASVYRRNWALS
jgi:hypothetical protein